MLNLVYMSLGLPLPRPATNTAIQSAGLTTTSQITEIKSVEVKFNDNVLVLNTGEIGNGITKSPPISGFEITRGVSPNLKFIYNEITQKLEFGPDTGRDIVPVIVASNNTIPLWDGSKLISGFSNTQYTRLNNIDQPLNSSSSPTFQSVTLTTPTLSINNFSYQFPLIGNTVPNTVLVNSGNGILTWTPINGVSGTVNTLSSNDNSIYINMNSDLIRMNSVTLNQDLITVQPANTTIWNGLILKSGVRFNNKIIPTTSYTGTVNDCILKWNGVVDCTITLPPASNAQCLIIENLSNTGKVIIQPTGGDLLDSDTNPVTLNDQYDHIEMIGDGSGRWLVL